MSSPPPNPDPPRQGISFHALREAFAQVLGGRKKAKLAAAAGESPDETPRDAGPGDAPAGTAEPGPADASLLPAGAEETGEPPEPALEDQKDDACPVSPETIFEAMLFVGSPGGEPLTAAQAAELMRGVTPEDIPELADALNRRYEAGGCPYRVAGEGAGYRLSLCEAFYPVRDRFYGRLREARLSPAAVDVLAIVAYRQPLGAEEVGRMRGHPSNHLLSQLVRRRLLRIERSQEKGQPPAYCTTDRFLTLFGLQTLDDLPQAEDV